MEQETAKFILEMIDKYGISVSVMLFLFWVITFLFWPFAKEILFRWLNEVKENTNSFLIALERRDEELSKITSVFVANTENLKDLKQVVVEHKEELKELKTDVAEIKNVVHSLSNKDRKRTTVTKEKEKDKVKDGNV
ncbi:MAG: hypothetical protein KGZ97_09760 [Bacteroidetes bacterium]|nr:hypothetical protein [Bacteroidota bacterium]